MIWIIREKRRPRVVHVCDDQAEAMATLLSFPEERRNDLHMEPVLPEEAHFLLSRMAEDAAAEVAEKHGIDLSDKKDTSCSNG